MTRPETGVPDLPDLPDKSAIRDAATILVVRDAAGPRPSVLMGQRGKSAAFMPGKFVFPGGAVDLGDQDVALARPLPAPCDRRIGQLAPAIAAAAIRELWEETGLALGCPGTWQPAPGWETFANRGLVPAADGLRYVFRAITPPGRPRRFDARFLLADAAHVAGDPDDFSQASDELNHLQWIPLDEARSFDLPFITEVVLAEVAARLPSIEAPERVAFFDNSSALSRFQHIV